MRSAATEMITDRNRGERRRLLQAIEKLPSIHVGQHDVERDEREGLLLGEHERLLRGGSVQDLEAVSLELHVEELCGPRVVFDHEGHGAVHGGEHPRGGLIVRGRHSRIFIEGPNRQPDRESRALGDGALGGQGAAMQLSQELDHRQAEPGPFEPSSEPAIDSGKWHEQLGHGLRRNADAAVGDLNLEELGAWPLREREAAPVPCSRERTDVLTRNAANPERDAAAIRGKLHRIRQQVIDNLLDLAGVGPDEAQVGLGCHAQVNMSFCRSLLHDRKAVREERRRLHRLQVERHLSGFDLGEVENIIDER